MSVLQRLSTIHELPTLPENVLEIERQINAGTASSNRLAEVISRDPPLTAKILKVANSVFFKSVNQRINSLQMAVTRIGFEETKKLAVAISLIKQFTKTNTIFNHALFWQHSFNAATLMHHFGRIINRTGGPHDDEVFFLSGLLHDIGMLVYDQFFPQDFSSIIDDAITNQRSFLTSEQRIAAKETHGVVGSALLELWKMDQRIVAAIRNHHTPERAPENSRSLVAALYLSEYVLCNKTLGSFEGSMDNDQCSEMLSFLGLHNDFLEEIEKKVRAEQTRTTLFSTIISHDTDQPLHYI